MDWDKASAELKKKLDPAHVKQRTQGGGSVAYVEGWHAIAEMNRIFGFGSWDRTTEDLRLLGEPRDVSGKIRVEYMARVRVTVTLTDGRTVTRDGCGFGQGIDKDVGQAHESALKEAETDAMKRAMMTFGNPFGLALYDKTRENVGVDAPAFDAKEIKTRCMNAIIACSNIKHLGNIWKAMAKDLGDLKRHDEADFAEVERVKNKMKQELETAA